MKRPETARPPEHECRTCGRVAWLHAPGEQPVCRICWTVETHFRKYMAGGPRAIAFVAKVLASCEDWI